MVAGAPFFFADGEGDLVGLSVSPSPGEALGLGDGIGDSSGVGLGEGDVLRFFFFGEALGEESGDGVGEAFFFLGEMEGLGSGFSVGVGVAAAFFLFEDEGEGDFSGVADGFGGGDFSATSFFFVALLRCFRGAGVGVGAKIFLSLLPNDSSHCACSVMPKSVTIKKREPAILLTRRMERESSTSAKEARAANTTAIPSRTDGEMVKRVTRVTKLKC